MKIKITEAFTLKCYGEFEIGLSPEDIAGDVLVYHYSAESLCGEIDTDEIDIDWSASRNFRSMNASEFEYFGLEATEDQQAVRFEIDFARSVVLENPKGTSLGEVLDSLSFDWHVEGAESDTELVSVHLEILER